MKHGDLPHAKLDRCSWVAGAFDRVHDTDRAFLHEPGRDALFADPKRDGSGRILTTTILPLDRPARSASCHVDVSLAR
jgi:hypothetical protein